VRFALVASVLAYPVTADGNAGGYGGGPARPGRRCSRPRAQLCL